MNRVMIDVFPTLWSPRKTNLYLANGAKLVAPATGLRAAAGFAAESLILFYSK
jgi:hypothetical protein